MNCERKISENLYYVGASDRRLDRFENLLQLTHGVSYNSYLFTDTKTCLMDTCDTSVTRTFLENVETVLGKRKLDYLVIEHMEPDHCYNVGEILLRYPDVTIVGNAMTFQMLSHFFPTMELKKKLEVKEGDVLSLGKRQLHFYLTPMVHWPEVMMTFESTEGLLFSADAFGSFHSLDGNLYWDDVNYDRDWIDESRRYYSNIVGRYGRQVQAAFAKLRPLPITMILPLHGLLFRGKGISYMFDKYEKWSTYMPEEKKVIIVYGSMYGDNENASAILANELSQKGVKDIRVYDASRTDPSLLVSEAFRVATIVLVTPTYNTTIYPAIDIFLDDALRMGLSNRSFALIQNGSWCPAANALIKEKLVRNKSLQVLSPELTITSSLTKANRKVLDEIAVAVVKSLS